MGLVHFECYDEYGTKEYELEADIDGFQFEQVLVDVDSKVYKTINYRFDDGNITAICGPVSIIKISTGGVAGETVSA